MSSTECLKQFVSDKLAAVAEEIFEVFHNAIGEYEEELERYRKLFDAAWKPVVNLRRTELPQQLVLREELIVADQSSLDQDRKSIADQEEDELPQIKEQQEELSSSELALKQEPEDLQLYSADWETNRNGDTVVDWNPEEPLQESEVKFPVITSVVSEANSDLSLHTGVPQSQELKEDKCENSKSTRRKRKNPNSNFHKSQSDEDRNVAVPKSNTSFTGDSFCKMSESGSEVQNHRESHVGKNVSKTLAFSSRGTVSEHKKIHRAKKSHDCQKCGKSFSQKSDLSVHNRIHTGEKPFVCLTCGKRFARKDHCREHEGTHTDERHVCQECNKSFSMRTSLTRHMKVHTGEESQVCQECNQTFSLKKNLVRHMKIHTGERPYVCQTCAKSFRLKTSLKFHEKTHTGVRPHVCQECNKSYLLKKNLVRHMKTHTGERPYVCQTCGKSFRLQTSLKFHERTHKFNLQLFSATVENQSRDPTVDCHPEEPIEESAVKTPVSISAVSEATSELQQRSLSPAVSQSQAQRKGEHESGKSQVVCKTDPCKLLSPGPLLGDKVIHTVKKHVSQECGKSFVRKSYRIERERVHTGERPQTCGKGFTLRSSLNHHKKLHTGGKTEI
ncbi:uncharacterized protein LOC142900614 [Nelusetta ayraudi]|uniref:uncharacterized protein LOC142900614 n=1 Tax=Nelusetta ayraudi TaxID=303726 RepID=UPI003F6FA1AE